ncbi:ATP-binding cassette domain-containing protein [Marinibaculum pumilum]|uniref:ATP-binding cassette domain-containing protein n=1 Tax=Marinibaculum pumilum TaxID=1766165 RepID=A0ABV7L5R4_9PROT
MTAGLTLSGVAARLHGRRLFAPLSLTVAPGQVATVMGPSGTGKSTLLALICGALDPAFEAEGRVLLDGRDLAGLPTEARQIGILFQEPLLFPHLSVAGNLAFGLPPALRGRQARAARVREALAAADLDGFEKRDPTTLSGGQRARIAVLRTLLSEPRALLLDEPFAGLDAAARGRFRDIVFDAVRRRALPTLLVTHDGSDAEAAGGPLVHLEPVAAEGPNGSWKSPM